MSKQTLSDSGGEAVFPRWGAPLPPSSGARSLPLLFLGEDCLQKKQ